MTTIRCAIYTRKSTEDGLEKEFNTLEAQREAGENYIKSQALQGWELIPTHYDDGGYSGGNMNRPALQQLLQDVENGLIDVIVIYKFDRLSRCMKDFLKIADILERNHCSFISITQNFGTKDSTGKLMLNILLSFAQFEREVITERIRDKVAASKKKGMWMGGLVPLGYNVINRKLIVNPEEAEIVKLIFEKYTILRSEVGVAEWLNSNGYSTINKGGSKFTHARISNMLKNVMYIGKIAHKEEIYEGQHEAIISQDLFDEVQKIKKTNKAGRLAPSRFMEHALLKGLIECDCCQCAMVSTKSNKRNKVYEYYTSVRAVKEGYRHCHVGNVPAGELDNFILQQLEKIISSPKIISGLIDEAKKIRPDIKDVQILAKLKDGQSFINLLSAITQRQLVELLIHKVRVNVDRIKIIYTETAINLMDSTTKELLAINNLDGQTNEILYRVSLHRKRGSIKIFAPNTYRPEDNNPLFIAISKAFKWKEIMSKEGIYIDELAKRETLSREYVGKVMRLTYLAPDIIMSIVDGVYPKSLSLNKILESEIPTLWSEQRLKYGF